jgi:hypothetical protein
MAQRHHHQIFVDTVANAQGDWIWPRLSEARRSHKEEQKEQNYSFSHLCLFDGDLETEPDRGLHYTRGASSDRSAEAGVCLLAGGIEDQPRVDVSEIRVIENVVNFPTKLKLAALTHRDVLEEGHVVIER